MTQEILPPRMTKLPDGRLQIHAHAKLNLGLRVFPPRPDGFHDLETWMVPISWHDTLFFDTHDKAVPLSLHITGRNEGIPTDLHKNLVGRAALALSAAANLQPFGTITLHKVLPPGGGIGGGSSDAAATLVALNHAWNLHFPEEKLEALAATLGSDIPFFIKFRPTLCTGRGEIMTPLPAAHPLFAVLIIPPMGCPTKDVYHIFDETSSQQPQLPHAPWQACADATAETLRILLVNDLAPAAFRIAPGLAAIRDHAAHATGKRVHLTGSGSTLFVLCDSGAEASEIEVLLTATLGPTCTAVPVRILPAPQLAPQPPSTHA